MFQINNLKKYKYLNINIYHFIFIFNYNFLFLEFSIYNLLHLKQGGKVVNVYVIINN